MRSQKFTCHFYRRRALTAFSFNRVPQVLKLITSFSDASAAHEAAADRIAAALDRYQEQPSILDPQLEAMVTPLLESVRTVARGGKTGAEAAVLPHACRVMYTLCKVRGYKTIVKFVPHEVADLEPLVHLLARYPPSDCDSWQIAYALMVWLSMVVMVPFDLSIIDSSLADAANGGRARRRQPARQVDRAARAWLPRLDRPGARGGRNPPRAAAHTARPESNALRLCHLGRLRAPKGPFRRGRGAERRRE